MNILMNLDHLTKTEQDEIIKYLSEKNIELVDEKTKLTRQPFYFYKDWAAKQNEDVVQKIYEKLFILLELDQESEYTNQMVVQINSDSEYIWDVFITNKKGVSKSLSLLYDEKFASSVIDVLNISHQGDFYDGFVDNNISAECQKPNLLFEMEI